MDFSGEEMVRIESFNQSMEKLDSLIRLISLLIGLISFLIRFIYWGEN